MAWRHIRYILLVRRDAPYEVFVVIASGLIGAMAFRSRNSAVEEMFCVTSAMQTPAPSKALEESGQIDDRGA